MATEPGERSERGEPAVEPAATAELAPQLGGPEVGDPAEVAEPEVTEPEVGDPADVTEPEVAGAAEMTGAAEVTEQAELGEPEQAGPELGDAVRAAARRRRLAEVFGDVLPEATSDDRSESGPPAGADDRWYTENR
ncbi:MAG: hypothetical protein QOD96_1019, partial [Pseudonocardiales bacterium]|nr:hypothetical protein [Pseudonocardiales bacterium]